MSDWPDPATLPPMTDAELGVRKRAMQERIIGLLAIEVDTAERVGSPHVNELRHALETMLKVYAAGD